MKTILIQNHDPKKQTIFKDFCLNFANAFTKKNNKVLYLLTSFNYDLKNAKKLEAKIKTIKPFIIDEITDKLHVLNLLTPEAKNIKINQIEDILFVLKKQIKMVEKSYDFLVIGLLDQWHELDQFFIDLNSQNYFHFLNAKDELSFPLSFIKDYNLHSGVVFANYSPLSKASNNNLKQLRLTYKNNPDIFVIDETKTVSDLSDHELINKLL